ncbi:plasmalemma vesicle-associated protein [Carettochelys insculpta]|uniref:plasmalemma vesicle-associated protein n=1 Tax=Carettochelys insculpta TaxID=44489 RepID=UPI003EB6AC19
MEKNAYAMAKFGLESRDTLSRKDCGFYMKYIFLFTSLIQFLIILGLVLFMIYGNAHAGTDTHLRHLEDQVQEMYSKVMALNAKNQNLTQQLNATTKEKLGCLQQKAATQKELEKCNSSLRACTGRELECRYILEYAVNMKSQADECSRNMNLLNITCFAEQLSLRETRDRLGREAQQLRENRSQTAEKLRQEASAANAEREQCRLQTIDLRAQVSGLLQSQRQCCSLGEKLIGEMQGVQQTIQAGVDKITLSNAYLPSECVTLRQLVSSQLKMMEDKVQQDLQLQVRDNGRLNSEKLRCDASLQECRRDREAEAQQFQRQLQAEKDTCDTKAMRSYQEKLTLEAENRKLSQQLQDKTKLLAQAEDTKAQLENCRKAKHIFPGNPGLRNPGFPGTVRIPGMLGNAGALGNAEKATLDALRQQIMEEFRRTSQSPAKPVEQPSG